MFKSTKKINTHKGIIFSLIMCLAAYANSSNYEEIHYKVKELAQDIYHDFKDATIKNTHGQKIYDKYQIKGIRKVKLWNGKLLPMCYLCWSEWINGGRK